MLRVEQIRNSPLELHEQIDPQKLIKVVMVNARPAADQKKIHFEANLRLSNTLRLVADPVLIRQAMENLVNNAIKYTSANGEIIIRANENDQRFNFIVEDNGIGIPAESIPFLFESFYRVRDEQVRAVEGSGLGLSLVRDVIERHGGQVWVESEYQKGSQFGFWLPLADHV
jgi:signal transduction histidine kinase